MNFRVLPGLLLSATIVCQMGSARSANRIDIQASTPGTVAFGPPEVTVWAGGQISWSNRTAGEHQPGVLNDDGQFVAFEPAILKPGDVSGVFSPMPRINEKSGKQEQIAFTIHYVCGLHRAEKGTIQVIPTP